MDEIIADKQQKKNKWDESDDNVILSKTCRAGGPVTCVSLPTIRREAAASNSCLLWALGPYLRRKGCTGRRTQLLVFPEDRGGSIHGLSYQSTVVPSAWDAVVYGGRQLAFCNVLDDDPAMIRFPINQEGTKKSHLTVIDWIWDVRCLPSSSESSTVVVGMARHLLDVWNASLQPSMEGGTIEVTKRRRIDGRPSCLVTSMCLFSVERELVRVAAGTAFQEIRIWSVDLQPTCKGTLMNNHTLNGHAGIIHSVTFSEDGQSLLSTSDDRSVRLWGYDENKDSWFQKWVGWGHSARVWSAAFASSGAVSVAEDGTTRVWSYETGKALTCIHHPHSLWSVDTVVDTAVVGSTDGSVVVFDLSKRIEGENLEILEPIPIPDDRIKAVDTKFTLPPAAEAPNEDGNKKSKSKKKSKKANMQVIVGLKWLDGSNLLVATRAGSVMHFSIEDWTWSQYQSWWDASVLETFDISASDGCCMGVHEAWMAVGTTRGDIILQRIARDSHNRTIFCAKSLKSVLGLKFISTNLLVSFHVRSVALWALSPNDTGAQDNPTWVLQMGTNGVPISCAYDELLRQVFVGDSRGNISLFQLSDETVPRTAVEAECLLLRVHHKEHVTSITLDNNRILSTGNDGSLHTSYRQGKSLRRGFSLPVTSMTGVHQVWYQSTNKNAQRSCVVSGYYGNKYRMIDTLSGHELFSVDTGGRQRVHDFRVEIAKNGPGSCMIVVCVNNKDGTNCLAVKRQNADQPDCECVDAGSEGVALHGETVFDAAFFSLGLHNQTSLLLTGSEDCTSKVLLCQSSEIVGSISLTPQESCVRAVCTSQIDQATALLVVGGGKLMLQFFLAMVPAIDMELESLDEIQIAILGHGVSRQNASIDHRINAVKAVALTDSSRSHIVISGDSDGNCHLFIVSEDTDTRSPHGLLLETSSRPILTIDVCPVYNMIMVAIGTTGGDVLIYSLPRDAHDLRSQWDRLNNLWVPHWTHKVHQMGSNSLSLSIKPTPNHTLHATLFTGGDDQAVSISQLVFQMGVRDGDLQTLQMCHDPSIETFQGASFSAVKGTAEVQLSGETYYLFAGYTQRLSVWKREEGRLTSAPHVITSKPVDLGDVNCLARHCLGPQSALVAVGGLGIELFQIDIIQSDD